MRLESGFFEKMQEVVPLKRRIVDGRWQHVDEELGVARESFGFSERFTPAESIQLERQVPFLGRREEVERAGKGESFGPRLKASKPMVLRSPMSTIG